MALKVIAATEEMPVTQLVTVIYGEPGAGKTTFAYSAADPFLIDFDGGAYRSGKRFGQTAVIDQWQDLDDLAVGDARTIVIDTAGAALDMLAAHILADNPKSGTRAGGLTVQGYGQLKHMFLSFLKGLIAMGRDVVIVTHGKEERPRTDGDTVVRIDMTGGSKDFVYQIADILGYLYRDGSGRTFNCSPTGGLWGKNPAGWHPVAVGYGDGTLARLIADAKSKIGRIFLEDDDDSGDFALADVNARLDRIVRDNGSNDEKRALLKIAAAAGFDWDDDVKRFVDR